MNPVRQLVDGTKGSDTKWQATVAESKPVGAVERPEEVMEKLHQQATHLGPVMEEILRTTHGRGQSHWGLNE